jgi:hypothetical protein
MKKKFVVVTGGVISGIGRDTLCLHRARNEGMRGRG